jgi:NADPH:quinone reductase-like Zn-dependent oxidoreductase
MRAVVRDVYGPPQVLRLEDVDKPEVPDDGVLVRIRASSVNAADWYALTGTPYVARGMLGGLRKPKRRVLGTDFSGVVEGVGNEVTELRPGDEVFGGARSGAFAEYAAARVRAVAAKPPNVTFEDAAAVPIAGLTALQGLRDKGGLQPGHHVLINGASGGVGTFAVQIAKALGAEVTAVCSTRNVEQAQALGADHVIDYTRDDFTRSDERYDLMLDIAGSRSWSACRRILKREATLVIVGAQRGGPLLGPLSHTAKIRLASLRGSQKAVSFISKFDNADLETLRELLEIGKVKPVVERRYALPDVPDAVRYIGEGHVRGKIVIIV